MTFEAGIEQARAQSYQSSFSERPDRPYQENYNGNFADNRAYSMQERRVWNRPDADPGKSKKKTGIIIAVIAICAALAFCFLLFRSGTIGEIVGSIFGKTTFENKDNGYSVKVPDSWKGKIKFENDGRSVILNCESGFLGEKSKKLCEVRKFTDASYYTYQKDNSFKKIKFLKCYEKDVYAVLYDGTVNGLDPSKVTVTDVTDSNDEVSYADEYIFPNGQSVVISNADIKGLDSVEFIDSYLNDNKVKIAHNEIHARYGKGFEDQGLQNYFDEKHWYHEEYSKAEYDNTDLLNSTEDVSDENFCKYRYRKKY